MTRLLLVLFTIMFCTGCQTIGYYGQAIEGQLELLSKRKPIPALLADPSAPDILKEKLRAVLDIRAFAAKHLELPVDGSYLQYADLGRRYVVWNVHAAPALSLEPKEWLYPLIGRLSYRGYFSKEDALEYGARLDQLGYDVYVDGVETYSTLGWFNDPILNTFVHHENATLAEILFHELAHQKLFVRGDTDFNEAFATAVAEEGVRRWLAYQGKAAKLQQYETALRRERQFVNLVMTTRAKLEELYDAKPPAPHLEDQFAADLLLRTWQRREKERILAELHRAYAELKEEWNGYPGYDLWFAGPVNNAKLNSVATYYDLVPGFHALLDASGGQLEEFYAAVRQLGKLPEAIRHGTLKELARLNTHQQVRASENPRFMN